MSNSTLTHQDTYKIIKEVKTGTKLVAKYAIIAALSAAEGVYEAITDAPGLLKYILPAAIPIGSAVAGARAECKYGYGDEFGISLAIEEKGFDGFLTSVEGAVQGGGLSLICGGLGYGATKGLMKVFS